MILVLVFVVAAAEVLGWPKGWNLGRVEMYGACGLECSFFLKDGDLIFVAGST